MLQLKETQKDSYLCGSLNSLEKLEMHKYARSMLKKLNLKKLVCLEDYRHRS